MRKVLIRDKNENKRYLLSYPESLWEWFISYLSFYKEWHIDDLGRKCFIGYYNPEDRI